MKKKGFTLVELLAVIVILAIIALISTPIILGVIETAKKGAAEQSALGYIDAVEKQIVINSMDEDKNNDFENKEYNEYTIYELTNLGVKVKGTVPKGGNITIKNGKVESATLTVGDYNVKVEENGKVTTTKTGATKEEKYSVYANGTAVYYNPETNKKCSESEANQNVNTNGTPTGIKTGCMKWYTFNDEGEKNSKVNMILDHNTTAEVAWNSTGSNSEMKEVATALSNDTTNWDSSLNARLITANEVAKITDYTTFDASKDDQEWFCLDTNKIDSTTLCSKAQGTSKYAWLFDYTIECKGYGCNIEDSSTWGYWTSTPNSSTKAWRVHRNGYLSNPTVNDSGFGVRPVITVSKSVIK